MKQRELHAELARVHAWFRGWGVPDLVGRVTVQVNPRLRTSLARARVETHEVQIHEELTRAPPALLREALCHEAAHLAAYALHGPRIRPHGREWAALMRDAGYEPRVVMAAGEVPCQPPRAPRPRIYEHRCPVCQMVRFASRRVQVWRCRECVEAGLDGRLLITVRRRRGT